MDNDAWIRPFRPGDETAMLMIHGRSIQAISETVYTRAELDSWNFGKDVEGYLSAMASGEVYHVAVSQDELAGFCGHKLHPDGWGEICGLYVDPGYQGRGLGKRLMANAEQMMRAAGRWRIWIEASLAALSFYEAGGYRVVEELTHTTRGGLPLAMRRVEKVLGQGI
ncbi:MAG: GNAT family N-acetyltransferase [Pseudomonadota bacterium]